MSIPQPEVDAVATAFSALVRVHLADALETIRERNRQPKYLGCCATHDFCDANEVMAEAFTKTTGRAIDLNSQRDTDLWNAAWDQAKAAEFRETPA